MKNSRRITAAILAAALCASPVLNANSELISSIMSVNTITASAATTTSATVKTINGKDYLSLNGIDYQIGEKAYSDSRGIVRIAIINSSAGTNIKFPKEIYTNNSKYKGYYDIVSVTSDFYANNKTSIKSIDFSNCSRITTLLTLKNRLNGFSALTSVTLPPNLKFIAPYVFSGCSKLNNINTNEKSLETAIRQGGLGKCPTLKCINNTQVVKYSTLTNRPSFCAEYEYYMKKYVSPLDEYQVSFMEDYRNLYINYVVKTETAGCTNDAQKIRKLHDWVCNKVNYAFDSNGNPDKTDGRSSADSIIFIDNKAICAGYAKGFTLLLRGAGLEAYTVDTGVPAHTVEGGTHAWNIVKLNGTWFHIDTCHDGSYDDTKYTHYLKSTNDIQLCNAGHNPWALADDPRIDHIISKPNCVHSLGDANMDYKVNTDDETYIRNILLGKVKTKNLTITDVNGNGKVDMGDALMISDLIYK